MKHIDVEMYEQTNETLRIHGRKVRISITQSDSSKSDYESLQHCPGEDA